MPSRITVRNPFAVPDVSSEGFWLPPGPRLGDKVSVNDRAWARKLEPHERLFAHHTLNSIRRDHRLVRTEVPNDALDLALTASYVHSKDTMVPKMYVPMQPEALGRGTWRVLRNEIKASSLQSGIFIRGETPASSALGETFQSAISVDEEAQFHSGNSTVGQQFGTAEKGREVRENGSSSRVQERERVSAASRAASAPHRSTLHGASRMQHQQQLHRYAGKTHHVGIPDRVEKIHPSSLKLAIEGPHTDQTNAGYSRKDDGTFYGV